MKKVIGFTGTTGAGKDTAADYVSKRINVPVFQISQPLRDEAERRGLPADWKILVDLGVELADKHGHDYLAKILLERSGPLGIISGMRQMGQIRYLRSNSELFLIAVDADAAIRFERARARGRIGEGKTLGEFIENEKMENSRGVQDVWACMEMADFNIRNESGLEELYASLDRVLREVGLDN